MKKILIVMLAVCALAGIVLAAGLEIVNAGMFYAVSSSTNSTAVIMPQAGRIALMNLSATCDTNQLTAINKYAPSFKTVGSNAAQSATSLWLQCDPAGTIQGHTIGSNDYMICVSGSTPTLFNITGYDTTIKTNNAANNDYCVRITNTVTCALAARGAVYIVSSNAIVSATHTTNVLNATYQGVSNPEMPIAVRAVGTGSTSINGMFEVWK